jgi:diamine N-acetyltransferase
MTSEHRVSQLIDKRGESFTIRAMAAGDREALDAMYLDFRPKRMAQGLPPEDEPALRRWLDRIRGTGHHLVVEVGGRLVGHGFLIPMGTGTVELANFLHQTVRDRGIGTALNRALLELAREQGHERVWLSVEPWNRAAVRSYQKVGFRQLPGSLWAPEIEMEADPRAAGR